MSGRVIVNDDDFSGPAPENFGISQLPGESSGVSPLAEIDQHHRKMRRLETGLRESARTRTGFFSQ
jgi:hypothetical protein